MASGPAPAATATKAALPDRDTILAALDAPIERPHLSVTYRLGVLLVAGQGSALSPFIYALF